MIALHARRQDLKDRHARDRAIMVAYHLEARGIADPLVLAAMGEVPREAFVRLYQCRDHLASAKPCERGPGLQLT